MERTGVAAGGMIGAGQPPNDVRDFMVRFSADPVDSVPALRIAVAALDPQIRLERITTMEGIVAQAFAPWRFSSVVVSAFAAIALTRLKGPLR